MCLSFCLAIFSSDDVRKALCRDTTGRTHVDYVPLAAPAEALRSGESPVFVLTAHYYLTDVTEETGER